MNIYIEDVVLLDALLSFLSVFLFVNLLKIKRDYFLVISAIILQFLSMFFIQIFTSKFKYISCLIFLVIPLLFRSQNIQILLVRQGIYLCVNLLFYLVSSFCFYFITKFNLGSTILVLITVNCLLYFLLSDLGKYLLKNNNKNIYNKKILINGNLLNAIIDSGNKILYKGTEVIVLDKEYSIKFSNKTIEVSTINSKKLYKIGFIKELNCSGKYFYNVPAIVESKNTKVILPLKYS